jgi:hypothetical protein
MNVAPDRPVYPTKEEDLERAAQLVLKHAEDQITIAGILYGLNRAYGVREIAQKLKERGVATFSHTWIAKLVKIWGHWVVRSGYTPDQLTRLPIMKLYFGASYEIDDLDFIRANQDLSDSEFLALLRKEQGQPPTGKLMVIPAPVIQQIEEIIKRLASYGHHATTLAIIEYAIETVSRISDDVLNETWMYMHGELPSDLQAEDTRAERALN